MSIYRYWLKQGAVVALGLVVSLSVYAETSLYEITKGDQKIYLGGTIHLLRSSDYPLPVEYEQAYSAADSLVLETNLDNAASPEFGQKMAKAFMYSGGKTLAQDLQPKLWQELQAFAAARQYPLAQMTAFKAMFVSLSLSVVEMQRLGFGAAEGVDAYFLQKAKTDNKPVMELETGDEVLKQLALLADIDANMVIKSTLRDLHKMERVLEKALVHWRRGELEKLDREMSADMRREAPEVYQHLLIDRNQAWLPKIEAMFATADVELVLVGSLHLSSKDGLLAQLKKRGYHIKPYQQKH
ncbi:polysaccharide biosynthesis protein GumN [Cellvibrio mixtus]|uniref:Polysaccharide biosynthesis protein GumN n=1 Tax=Cellvibrio mixtus TaxID=39650 RepID=A0A266QAV1_9GAMM|nr:TraB/GumN family protein [Cellvibrio mixtus]OZY86998.1 polysaccharide biosynthesis protein GumN [Cellvibrio mixtus]